MKTYITDIIPRIQRFSNSLDNTTLLTNQHWVILDDLINTKVVYIFRKNGELLISTNGLINKTKWEFLGQNSILINLKDKSYLLKHGFFDENILALKIDGKNEYAILINETKYGKDLNSIESVERFLRENYVLNSKYLQLNNIFVREQKFLKAGVNIRMGLYYKYLIKLSNERMFEIYQKVPNDKFYFYHKGKILLFPDEESCHNYLIEYSL